MNFLLIDRSSAVTTPDGDFYRLRTVWRRGSGIEVKSHGRWESLSDHGGEFVLADDIANDVVEWSPGQLLLPVDTADFGDLPVVTWLDVPEGGRANDSGVSIDDVPLESDDRAVTRAWRPERLGERHAERRSPAKEALLRRSLSLVQGAKTNEDAVRAIVMKSLDAGLISLGMEACRAFASNSDFTVCVDAAVLSRARVLAPFRRRLRQVLRGKNSLRACRPVRDVHGRSRARPAVGGARRTRSVFLLSWRP